MNISVFGLGYVGAVTSACLARSGHTVIGVDPAEEKLRFIREGKSPIIEDGLDDMIADAVNSERLSVTDDYRRAVAQTELSLVCVGTPSTECGGLRTEFVERVVQQIGEAIRAKRAYHSVVIRSTVLPGTTREMVVPILEHATGGRAGKRFGISMHPEFLREGKSVYDFFHPPYTIVGTDSHEEFDRVCSIYDTVQPPVSGERIRCEVATAETIKYGCNLLHAVKITFANEIGVVCKRAGIDSREVMDILCRDTKLNISPRYFAPGFAFGGSCLPKDLRAFTDLARKSDLPIPMLDAVLLSNRVQIDRVADRVRAIGHREVAFLGISFKEGTDDLRESPLVSLAEHLIGKGYALRIFDPNVQYASLHGSNKQFIDRELPHLKSLLCAEAEAVAHGRTVVLGHGSEDNRRIASMLKPGHALIDLVGLPKSAIPPGVEYHGLYW